MTVVVPIGGSLQEVGVASRRLKDHLRRVGVDTAILRRVMIAAYEAEANVAIHARRGTLFARLTDARIDLEIVDEGPGIADVELALTEGYSTASEEARKLGFGAGLGLPNIRKSSDTFEIETVPGRGTRIRSTILLAPQAAFADTSGLAPRVEAAACRRCLACVRACPVEALRLGREGPFILEHLCVGCAACMQVCAHGVFSVPGGERIEAERGAVLVSPRALVNQGSGALREAGFVAIRALEDWEEAVVRHAAGHAIRARAAGSLTEALPRIAPTCAAVVHLVETAYPSLVPNLEVVGAPVEAAVSGLDLAPVTVVAGCAAQVAALEAAGAARARITTPQDLGRLIRGGVPAAAAAAPTVGPRRGAGPSASESAGAPVSGVEPAVAEDLVLRVDGLSRVARILALAERGLLDDFAVLDLRGCVGGCGGAPGAWTDPAVAVLRARRSAGTDGGAAAGGLSEGGGAPARTAPRKTAYAPRRGVRLDPDMRRAMEKLRRIDEVQRTLPGRDCTVCGSPTCAAHAEDLVLGRAVSDCPYVPGGAS